VNQRTAVSSMNAETRTRFIEENALDVRNLDV
jgi:hypothetical protein